MFFLPVEAQSARPGSRLGEPDGPELLPRQRPRATGRWQAHPRLCTELETGGRAARQSLRLPGKARCHEQARRFLSSRSEQETPRGGKIIMSGEAPDLADDSRRRRAFQSLFHGPEAFLRIARLDQDHTFGIKPEQGKPRRIGKPRLTQRLRFENPQDRAFALHGKPRGQR